MLQHIHAAVGADRTRIGHEDIYRLRGIDAASSSDGHKTADLLLLRQNRSRFNEFIGRIRNDGIKNHSLHSGFLYLRKHFSGNPRSLHAAVVDHHDLLQAMFCKQFRENCRRAGSETDIALYKEMETHPFLLPVCQFSVLIQG